MNKLFLAAAVLLSGGIAQAAQLHCEGSYYFYHFVADAATSGNQIVGNITITVTGGANKTVTMNVTSSDVQEGRYIHATGSGADGSGQLSADYDADNQSYSGTLYANTSSGSANVDVVCTMTQHLNPAFDMSVEEAHARGLYPVEQY